MLTLESIEGHNDQVREELEQHIASIQKSITVCETSYNGNLQVLGTISESLMNILRNVSVNHVCDGQVVAPLFVLS